METTGKIGIFDSGIGGLSILKELECVMPDKHYIYFGDTKNLPYGTKSKEEIIAFTEDIIKFFLSIGVKDIVMACNTSSALAYDTLLKKFEGVVTIHPLIQTVAKDIAKYSHIGVMATEGTVKSFKYTQEIIKNNRYAEVFEVECTGLVEIVENGLYEDIQSFELVKSKVDKLLEKNVEKIVLGCTHYPYLMPILERFADRDMFIDPASILCKHVKNLLSEPAVDNKKEFFVSSYPERFIESAKVFYSVEYAELVETGASLFNPA